MHPFLQDRPMTALVAEFVSASREWAAEARTESVESMTAEVMASTGGTERYPGTHFTLDQVEDWLVHLTTELWIAPPFVVPALVRHIERMLEVQSEDSVRTLPDVRERATRWMKWADAGDPPPDAFPLIPPAERPDAEELRDMAERMLEDAEPTLEKLKAGRDALTEWRRLTALLLEDRPQDWGDHLTLHHVRRFGEAKET